MWVHFNPTYHQGQGGGKRIGNNNGEISQSSYQGGAVVETRKFLRPITAGKWKILGLFGTYV